MNLVIFNSLFFKSRCSASQRYVEASGRDPVDNLTLLRRLFRRLTVRSLALSIILSTALVHAGKAFKIDFAAAEEEAARTGKDMFLAFTASDWSLSNSPDKAALSWKEFRDTVGAHFVLLQIDYSELPVPRITPEFTAKNQALRYSYLIHSFPKIYLCDSLARPYSTTGYDKISTIS